MAALLGCLFAMLEWQRQAQRRGEELAMAVARMPSGIAAADADRLLGGRPDRILEKQAGVLVNSATLLAATNSQAASHGPPQSYDIRIWRRGGVTAFVVVDRAGRVAARYTWQDDQRAKRSAWLGR